MTATVERAGRGAPAAARAAAEASASSTLERIAARRREDVAREFAGRSVRDLEREAARAPAPRDLALRLAAPGLHLIAEVKRRSPSAGELLGEGADIRGIARAYERGGAAAVSVLVEPHGFGGTVDDLRAVREAIALPVLAKEFVVDPRQVPLVRAAGADAVLLLAALHGARALRALVRSALDLGLEPIVEAHDRRELDRALSTGARLVGINNRDLRTLITDATRAERLRELVPGDRLVVAESGVRHPDTLARWRAVGFDAALVGETLLRGAARFDDRELTAAVAAFAAAGRDPAPAEDPAGAERRTTVKICGVTDDASVDAAVGAGADAIGLNLVPGTRRALSEEEAVALACRIRAIAPADRRPAVVAIVADRDPGTLADLAARVGADAVQLSGRETADAVAAIPTPVRKVLHLPPSGRGASTADDPGRAEADLVAETIARARAYLSLPNVTEVIVDAADPRVAGGTGRRLDTVLVAAVAREVPITLAGGLDPANVGAALRAVAARGVDVASGVEPAAADGARRPTKDPLRTALFVKRARSARDDRPAVAARPAPVPAGLLEADERGRWGMEREFGGRFVPETLVAALEQLERAYAALRHDPRFWAELRALGRDYVGRPTPLYRADRLAAAIERELGRERAGLRLYLKREDLAHTGAHKINNAIGQALLGRHLGKPRVIAETGAGQHGVATATACALLGLECVVYMGAEDIRRQAPNVLRMRALGAEVRSVTAGTATLKDAINEAMRDWVTNVATTHYVLGSAVGPHPYPSIVRDLQRVIGDEAAAQIQAVEGRLPDAAVACVGGGSNAIGLFARFIGEPTVRLIGVEAAGDGLATGRHAAALAGGSPGVLHGSRSYLLQDADGQVTEAHSISAGLDYPGIGPQLSALFAAGRMEVLAATDTDALDGLRLLARTEGILPALEPSHAIAILGRLLRGEASGGALRDDAVILLGLSGRGDKDLAAIADDPAPAAPA